MTKRSQVSIRPTSLLPGILLLALLAVLSQYNYLLFHVLAELISIVIAWGIFMVAANAWQFHENEYLSLIGVAYLFVGGLDLVHTLAYKGMNILPGYNANLPTQLWIAARYMESLSLVCAPLFLRRKLQPHIVFLGYASITGVLLLSLFYWQNFPDCYVEGSGLTAFKRVSEYVISGILLVAAAITVWARDAFDGKVYRALLASIVVTIASELTFTAYVGVYDFFNLLGHLLKLVSFYLIYKAFVETGLVQPYNLLFRNLKQSQEALQRENQELDAFAHTVAHDLKTPLSLVLGFADLLCQGQKEMTEAERSKYLQSIAQNSQRMSNIVSELLLLAQVRKYQVEMTPVPMADTVSSALDRLDHMIQKSGAQIHLPVAWPAAQGHAGWIEEIWVNYISNALEHGGYAVHIELGADVQSDGMIRFWVRDSGPGISPDDQQELFTPFTRLAQVQTKGQGLGLSIVRRIADKLEGQVGVDSELGQGSTFYFCLPQSDQTESHTPRRTP